MYLFHYTITLLHVIVPATYRGCFDDFVRVVRLQANYIGCRNQTWNNRSLRWCFCATELCNGVGMETLETMTESAPTKPEQPVLHMYTITTRPAVLNTDHGVFKYIEGEEEEEKEDARRAITSRPSAAAAGKELDKSQARSNAVPTKAKLNRAVLKQSNGEEAYYELIGKPVESLGTRRTAVERELPQIRHGVNSANKVRPSGPPQRPVAAMKQDEEIFDRDYELGDLDYPYNQDMFSISKIVEKLSKVENPHQNLIGSFRSSDKVLPTGDVVSPPTLPQSEEIQPKSAKVKSHYEEPLQFKSHVSSELGKLKSLIG